MTKIPFSQITSKGLQQAARAALKPRKIAFDITLMRPACATVAAAYGASTTVCHEFPTSTWLMAPTPDMAVYEITPDQLAILVARVGRAK